MDRNNNFNSIFINFFFVMTKNYKFQQEQMNELSRQKLPNLKIISIDITKSHPTETKISDNSYIRIYNGKSNVKNELKNLIATFDASDLSIEPGFIQEVKSHIDKPNVYFTYYNEKPHLVANHATNQNSFIVDHSNAKMTFHNYGAIISAISIESLNVYYKEKMNYKDLTFFGNKENIITISPDDNEKFELFFDEVTTNLINSLCQISDDIYEKASESFDLLKTRMYDNMLTYDKLELNLICWDMYNNETKLRITIEYNGTFFVSSTTFL